MQQEDDLRALENIVQFARGLSVFWLVLNVYWFCYEGLASYGLNFSFADRMLIDLQRSTGLFSHSFTTKLCSMLFLALGCYGTKSVRDGAVSRHRIALVATLGLGLFLLNDFLLWLPVAPAVRFCSYVLTLAAGYLCLLAAGVWLGRLIRLDITDDPFNDANESFMREERYLFNEYSVNLPTRYIYHGQMRHGWINVINPFRATIVLGTPGSGKSYAVVNSYIKQQILREALSFQTTL